MQNTVRKKFLGIEIKRPKVAFFELSSCEGCQLQILNNESMLHEFLSLFEIVNFREIKTEKSDDYSIAFVEGSVTREDEVERLKAIREKAEMVVALGSCACFGGVNQLKNRFRDLEWVKKEVYGNHPIETGEVRPLSAVIKIDLEIFGCPIKKEEVERIVTNLVLGKKVSHPQYPVCMECRANENICLFDLGEACLGVVTRGGCDSWCPSNRSGCWGCRGPAPEANLNQLMTIVRQKGINEEKVFDMMECFGGFSSAVQGLKKGERKV